MTLHYGTYHVYHLSIMLVSNVKSIPAKLPYQYILSIKLTALRLAWCE